MSTPTPPGGAMPPRRQPKRPESVRVGVTLTLRPATADRLRSRADQQGLSVGGFLAGLVEREFA